MHFSAYLFHAKFFFSWLIKRVCEVALNDETWVSAKNTIYRAKDSKPGKGTAPHIYCNRIRDMFGQYEENIAEYIIVGHAYSHGTRKGSAIEVSS